jgi:ribosomal protein L16/L10AE
VRAAPNEILRRRLAAQRISTGALATGALADPGEVVSWLGAVQAQDYLAALWAVGLRTTDAREKEVEQAISDRRIVRTWPMRGTLHFVGAADAR